MNSSEQPFDLKDYLSLRSFDDHDHQMHFLDLHRRLRQRYTIQNLTNHQTIAGISLAQNYLIQIPNFVSDLTNLVELNASENGLHDAKFLLYRVNSNEMEYSRPLIHPFLRRINLSFNHIESLPVNLHYLRFLHTLDLSHNYLRELPENFGFLEQLRVLFLNDNHLTSLPQSFTRLEQLEYLNFSANRFESMDMMKNFQKLRTILFDGNPLTTFPILLHTCENLENISASNIQLEKMKEITLEYFQQFPRLKKLNLSYNHLTNRFFSTIKHSFNSLEEFYLDHNQLNDLFGLLSLTPDLSLLDLSFNLFICIPQGIQSELKILRLSNNQIQLNGNDCGQLKSIQEFDLDHNEIDDIPYQFLQCAQLQSLNLSSNPLQQFPEILLQLRSLNKLVLDNHGLSQLPSCEIFRKTFHRTLNVLNLSGNQLQSNLHELTGLKALRYVDLSDNHLSELHQDFRLMTCLKVLKLNRNKFTRFSECFYQMNKEKNEKSLGEILMELSLRDNQLKSIPEEIIHMTALQTIDLSNNFFPNFPEVLVYLEQLTSLVYSQERGVYIDKLPDDFVQLHHLKVLDLSHNTFYEIPSIIYALPRLKSLNFSSNLLTALEVNRLKQLTQLEEIQLNGNQFPSFPSIVYQLERLNINDNDRCSAPPNDFLKGTYLSTLSNLFVQINDQFEERIFQIYKDVFVEHLANVDIERLLIRLKLSEKDIDHFRKNYHHLRREEKIEILFHLWKQKRDSLANSDTLYKLTQLIGDKKLVQHMKKACLVARRIRV